jgi:hypothetical protein
MKFLQVVFAFVLLSITAVMNAHALWYFGGNQVAVDDYDLITPSSAATDGAGGMVVVWASDEHVYAKRYDSSGAIVSGWSLVTVGNVDDTPSEAPQIIFNGTYWYVGWIDPHMVAGGGGTSVPGYIVRVAKLKSTGSVFHTASVFDATTNQAEYLTMAKRSGGGVALAWEDEGAGYVHYFRSNLSDGSSAQVSSYVQPMATTNPVQIVADNANGTLAVYCNTLGKALSVDSTATGGTTLTMINGSGTATDFCAISDGSGGAVMSFDVDYAGDLKIWLQYFSGGSTQWNQGGGVTGQPLCVTSCAHVANSRLALNSAGDAAILTWSVWSSTDLRAQKLPLSSFSRTTWGSNGKLVTSNDTGYSVPMPVANEDGYTTVVWTSSVGGSVFGVHYQILEDDGDLFMGGEGTPTENQSLLYTNAFVAGYDLNTFAAWEVRGLDDRDLRAARLVPIWDVAWEYNEAHCRNNVSWETVASATTNRLDYRRIGATPWTAKTPAGSSGSYNTFYPQYVPGEFKLRGTISSVEYESLVYQDYGSCGEPDPQGVSRQEVSVTQPYLNAQPNPFNPIVKIGYGVPAMSTIDLAIYDVAGRRVKTLVSGTRNTGAYTAVWTGEDDRGGRVSSGVYFSRLTVGGKSLTQKLVMLK